MAGEIPPQSAPKKNPKVFDCPSCGGGVHLRALGHTVTVVCASCGTLIDTTNENHKILSSAAQKIKVEPLIPLGQRGKIFDVTWEVIGFMQRSDGSGQYHWREYLLFNPAQGFRWLTEFDGHWNFVVSIKDKPTLFEAGGSSHVDYKGKSFQLFLKGAAKVNFVLGEFYWRVKTGERVQVKDFIAPPEILSYEANKEEIIWSLGQYVAPEEIRTAFQIDKAMPMRLGVAPNQPAAFDSKGISISNYWLIFVAILLILQIFFAVGVKNEKVYEGAFSYLSDDLQKVKVTPSFELTGGKKNLDLKFYSPVQNSWIEFQVDLVNEKTGEVREFEKGIEYYSGTDSDGYWTEGSQVSHVLLSAVPAGLYHLNIEASSAKTSSTFLYATFEPKKLDYTVVVTRDVSNWSNFFGAFLALSILPAFAWWNKRSFERARWSTSDYSPYEIEEEEEEE